jgi:hypothetical protein
VPRYWLADSQRIGIEDAPSNIFALTFQITSTVSNGTITARLNPQNRNLPKRILLRLRHRDAKPIRRVTLNGRSNGKFDSEKEWIILPEGEKCPQEIVARHD